MITADSSGLSERKAVLWIVRAISYLIYAYLIVVEIILFIGFFLLLFGANPTAGFTEWAYRNLDRVMAPFRGIFTPINLGTAGDVEAVFETSVLFAMIVYGILALAFSALIGWLSGRLSQIHAAEDEILRRAEAERLASSQAAAAAAREAATAQQGSPALSVTVQPASPTPDPNAGAVPPPPPQR